jgi:hypothetical protein
MTVLLHRSPRRLVPSGKTPTLPEPAMAPSDQCVPEAPLQQRRLFDLNTASCWASRNFFAESGDGRLRPRGRLHIIMRLGKRVQGLAGNSCTACQPQAAFLVMLFMAWSPVHAPTPADSRWITPATTPLSIPTTPPTRAPGAFCCAPNTCSIRASPEDNRKHDLIRTCALENIVRGALMAVVLDCSPSQPPFTADENLNPECAEEHLCPAQPASECPGTLWSAGPVDADLQKIGCASSPCALLAMISRTTAAAGSLSMISHSPSQPRHRCFLSRTKRNEYWSLARAHGVIGLSQRKRRNRAKSPSVEQSVSPCSTASAAR